MHNIKSDLSVLSNPISVRKERRSTPHLFMPGLEGKEVRQFLDDHLNSKQTFVKDKYMMEPEVAARFFNPSEVRRVLLSQGFSYPQTAKRIGFLMCKGGVGKTTLSYFLGQRLASYGARILYVDSDPQSNLSLALREHAKPYSLNEQTPVLVDVLTDRSELKKTIVELHPNMHLLPSTAVNSMLERELLTLKENPIKKLDLVLSRVDQDYDYVLIDCAPSLNIFNASVVYSSDLMVVPFQLNGFSAVGIKQTLAEIHDLERDFGFKTEIRAVLNGYSTSNPTSKIYLKSLAEQYKAFFMQTVVRQSPEIQKTFAFGKDFFRNMKSNARHDFDKLAVEILMSGETSA